jgi:mandelate racemase
MKPTPVYPWRNAKRDPKELAMPEALPRIRSLEVRCVEAPLARPLRTAVGSIPAAPLVLIDVLTEEGVTGRAYIFGYTPMTLAPLARFLTNLNDVIKGKTISPVERARDFDMKFRLLGRQGLVGMALAGLDMALWDALGRVRGVPVVTLLGGEAAGIPAYDSFGILDPAADRRALEQSLARGFRGIKIKIGGGSLRRDLETVAAVRDILGPEIALMVDYNQSLSVPEAIRRIGALAKYDLHWVEEPVPAEDIHGHAKVRASSPVPIQTGENWWFPFEMAKAFHAGACDYAMPDLMKIGGITGWLNAMGVAETASVPVSSHIFIEASAHVLAVTPTAHWLEYLNIADGILAEPMVVEDGRVAPRGPGLGMDWNREAVERYSV